jgi:hypothetical protein
MKEKSIGSPTLPDKLKELKPFPEKYNNPITQTESAKGMRP